jgi:Glycosyltransferase family 87
MPSLRCITKPAAWSVRLWPCLAALGWLLLAWFSRRPPAGLVWWLLALLGLEWALTVFLWRQARPERWRRWLVWGIAFRCIGLFAHPILDDDSYRFLWDGRMFAVTGNPYATVPASHFADATLPPAFAAILDHVSYPDVPTLYGPLTEAGFLLGYGMAPGVLWPWKLLLLGADVALLFLIRNLGRNETGARAAMIAAWCPLSVFETAFNAHPDALAVSLLTAALLARQSPRDTWLGFCCGAAAGARVFALLLAPFLLWRRGARAWIGFLAALLLCYAPFWWQGSTADLEGLRAFAGQWEFNSSVYGLLAWVGGPDSARPLSTLLFGAGWIGLFYFWARRAGGLPEPPPGLWVFGLFFLLSPTFNPWYALWLLPFVALRPTPAGLTVLAAVSLSYLTRQNLGENVLDGFAHPVWVRPLEFGLMGAAWGLGMRRRLSMKATENWDQPA